MDGEGPLPTQSAGAREGRWERRDCIFQDHPVTQVKSLTVWFRAGGYLFFSCKGKFFWLLGHLVSTVPVRHSVTEQPWETGKTTEPVVSDVSLQDQEDADGPCPSLTRSFMPLVRPRGHQQERLELHFGGSVEHR